MKCTSCSYDFNTGDRNPYVLKCGHNVCVECLEKYYNQANEFSDMIYIPCKFDFI